LILKCKSYERIKKTEKKRSKGEIKIEKGPRGTKSAQYRKQPVAQQ
jgi:hypothetical protein